MTGRLLLDLTHTSHTRARTGVQQVVRALQRELGERAQPVTFDPYLSGWRGLETWELENLRREEPSGKRRAQWPMTAKLRGNWRRLTGNFAANSTIPGAKGFLTAEIFSREVGAQLPSATPRVAVFHDAIALQLPELTPPGTVSRFPEYLRELLAFDGIAAVSEDSRRTLVEYWDWLGVKQHPPVEAIALGVNLAGVVSNPAPTSGGVPVVLSVGTLEGRKNHVALLDACEALWSRGRKFTLRLAGAAHAETGRAALERVKALQAAGRPLRYDGPLSDGEVNAAYAECAFTVYPSLAEGFGLPVIESLARGRPCICSGKGALGELSHQGGCVPLERMDVASIADAIGRLLAAPAEVAALREAAQRRQFRSWKNYADEIVEWMGTLS